MQTGIEIVKKIEFIDKNDKIKIAESLSNVIDYLLAQKAMIRTTSKALVRSLKIDLSYLFIKHLHYIQSTIFFDLAVDFLQSEYLLTNQVSEELIAHCIAGSHSKTHDVKSNDIAKLDEDFATKLFTLCLMAKSDQALRFEIGFGDNVIDLLRQALEFDDTRSDLKVFSTDILSQFVNVITKLQKQMASHPKMSSLYKLQMVLSTQVFQQHKPLTISQLENILELFLHIGPNGIKRTDLVERFNRLQMDRHINLDGLLRRAFGCELIFEQRLQRQVYIFLSSLGLKLLASELAEAYLEKANKSLDDLIQLPEIVQVEALKRVVLTENESLQLLYRIGTNLSSQALAILSRKLIKGEHANKVVEVLLNMLHNKENLWIRAEICRLLTEVDKSDIVVKAMEGFARQDPSPKVRHIAREYLSG